MLCCVVLCCVVIANNQMQQYSQEDPTSQLLASQSLDGYDEVRQLGSYPVRQSGRQLSS